MRLIDADELMRAMYERAFETDGDTMWQSGCWVRYRAIEEVVKEQPTIEPQNGKWVEIQDDIFAPIVVCSNCGQMAMVEDCEYQRTRYCPNCGARMERRQDE